MAMSSVFDLKINCYFFEFGEISHRVTCRYYGVKGECPCKDCKKFISSNEVENMVKKYVSEGKKIENVSGVIG